VYRIKCNHCKSYFSAAYKVRKYCSHKCYTDSMKANIYNNCLICGIKFKVNPSLIKKGIGKHCSTKCYSITHSKKAGTITYACDWCKKEFKLNKYGQKTSKRHFCHNKCYWAWRKGKRLNKATEWGMLIEERGFNYSVSWKKGHIWELKVKKHLEMWGYYVALSAGSRFPDIIAINKDGVVSMIECKSKRYGLTRAEREKFQKLKKNFRVECYLAYPKIGVYSKKLCNVALVKVE